MATHCRMDVPMLIGGDRFTPVTTSPRSYLTVRFTLALRTYAVNTCTISRVFVRRAVRLARIKISSLRSRRLRRTPPLNLVAPRVFDTECHFHAIHHYAPGSICTFLASK